MGHHQRHQIWEADAHTPLQFLGDGKTLIASRGEVVVAWDVSSGVETGQLEGHIGRVVALAPTHDNQYLVTAGHDSTLEVWNLETGASGEVLSGHNASVNVVALSLNDHYTFSGGDDRTLRVWETMTGQEIARFSTEAAVCACEVAPDGTVIVGDELGTLSILRLENLSVVDDTAPMAPITPPLFEAEAYQTLADNTRRATDDEEDFIEDVEDDDAGESDSEIEALFLDEEDEDFGFRPSPSLEILMSDLDEPIEGLSDEDDEEEEDFLD